MREGLNHWLYVYASYGLGVGATVALVWHSIAQMRRAESRREQSRGQ